MSDAPPVLEMELELCSDNFPVIPNPAESAIDQALERLHLRGSSPVPETNTEKPSLPANDEPQPAPAVCSQSRSRKSSRLAKRPTTKKSHRLFEALRSRRLRIVATAVGVLFLVGLIGLNWQRSGLPAASDELADMDLFEFPDDPQFGANVTERSSESRALAVIDGTDADLSNGRRSQSDSGDRMPSLGLVNFSEQKSPSTEIQTLGGISRPGTRGVQAAWLTGQVEFGSSDDSPRRSNGSSEIR